MFEHCLITQHGLGASWQAAEGGRGFSGRVSGGQGVAFSLRKIPCLCSKHKEKRVTESLNGLSWKGPQRLSSNPHDLPPDQKI